jgi:hypothetical protein
MVFFPFLSWLFSSCGDCSMPYTAFQTNLSSNVELGPLPVTSAAFPTLHLRVRRVAQLNQRAGVMTEYRSQGRLLQSRRRGLTISIEVEGMLLFSLRIGRGLVLCLATASARQDQIRYWFLQKILPVFLTLRGQAEILHAGAVEVGEQVIAFLAASGTGKSTLVQHFVSRGHNLVSDEHLTLDSLTNLAIPSLPYMRADRRLESLGVETERFCVVPRKISRLYLLEQDHPEAEVNIEELHGGRAAVALHRHHQFDLRGLADAPEWRHLPAERFQRIAQLAATTPVKRVRVPRSLGRLDDVYQAIQRDLR